MAPIDPALRGTGGLRLRVVRATDGAGVTDATVVLHGTGHGSEIMRVATRTDADGRVDLAEVPAGAWLTLQVRAPGEAPVVRADVDVVRDQVLDLGEIRVGARRSLRVSVIDEGALPVAGARVLAHALTADQVEALEWNAAESRGGEVPHASVAGRTDAEGNATLPGIPPGSCLVTAGDGVRVPARMVVDVPAGADPLLPALMLRTGATVGGRVVDPAGSPVVGAQVTAAWRRGTSYALPLRAMTDDQGGFRLLLPSTGVPCELVIEAEGRPQARVLVEMPREDLRVEMLDGATLVLSAADAITGTPLDHARVEIRVARAQDDPDAEPWQWQGRTDDDGLLRTWLPAGRVTALTVDAPWYRIGTASPRDEGNVFEPLAVPAEIVAGATIRVEARLHPRPHPSLEGSVRGPDGSPLADVGITDRCYGPWPPEGILRTDLGGAFRFARQDVSPGSGAWLVVL
ncbi:MAG TPA: carboxypeptidase-like regulatory domain-containing protein, partial [Planctomycetota bacterium]|nr:carboxypeptidase-like regulatory domain-containing protein [Planctomycetota bacterium]